MQPRFRMPLRFERFSLLPERAEAAGLPKGIVRNIQGGQPPVAVAIGVDTFEIPQIQNLAAFLLGVPHDGRLS